MLICEYTKSCFCVLSCTETKEGLCFGFIIMNIFIFCCSDCFLKKTHSVKSYRPNTSNKPCAAARVQADSDYHNRQWGAGEKLYSTLFCLFLHQLIIMQRVDTIWITTTMCGSRHISVTWSNTETSSVRLQTKKEVQTENPLLKKMQSYFSCKAVIGLTWWYQIQHCNNSFVLSANIL